MILNPYLILGAVLFWMASVGAAYYKGGVHAENAAKAEYSRQLESAIKEANDNAQIDMQAAREVGQREARAKVITRTITNEVVKVIHEKPMPAVCRWDADSTRLLDDAIKAANDLQATPKRVPDAGNTPKPASKPGS